MKAYICDTCGKQAPTKINNDYALPTGWFSLLFGVVSGHCCSIPCLEAFAHRVTEKKA